MVQNALESPLVDQYIFAHRSRELTPGCLPLGSFPVWGDTDNINPMEAALWVFLPGFVAIASGLLSWFVMQSRMEVKLAEQRETLAELRGQIRAEKENMELAVISAGRIAEETAKRESFDKFLAELKVEKRHYTRENRMLMNSRKSLVLQERMYFRNIPLSDWIEHEIMIDDGADVNRLVQDMTVFDKGVVSIDEMPRRKQLA